MENHSLRRGELAKVKVIGKKKMEDEHTLLYLKNITDKDTEDEMTKKRMTLKKNIKAERQVSSQGKDKNNNAQEKPNTTQAVEKVELTKGAIIEGTVKNITDF
jgi:hypothetical protein